MKLYTSGGPHPQVVAMFMAEKGVRIDAEKVDVRMNANRSPEHLARNPMGQVPTLQLDDGTCVSEIFAICEYLEDIRPVPALIGATPEEKAVTRMWARRIDLNIIEPLATSFRNGGALSLFKDRILTASEVSSGMRQMSDNCLRWLNDQMGGKTWICGDRFTLADIQIF
jgi:glutathione S-transferase